MRAVFCSAHADLRSWSRFPMLCEPGDTAKYSSSSVSHRLARSSWSIAGTRMRSRSVVSPFGLFASRSLSACNVPNAPEVPNVPDESSESEQSPA